MLKQKKSQQRWQKWDAIKHFICVIEFLWVIVLKQRQKNATRICTTKTKQVLVPTAQKKTVTSEKKKCHAFYERIALFHICVQPHSACDSMHFPFICVQSVFFFSGCGFCDRRPCTESNIFFFVFSLLLHYSFRCHFCSIYLNCEKCTMQRVQSAKSKARKKCNVFENVE